MRLAWPKRYAFITALMILVCSFSALAEITNGSFENGLEGITCSDNTPFNTCSYEAIQSLGNGLIQPTDGSFFLYVKTGPGDTSGDGAPDDVGILFNNIIIEEGVKTLSFDFNFLTEMDTPSQLGSDAIFISSPNISNANYLVECDTKTNTLIYKDDLSSPQNESITITNPFQMLATKITTADGSHYTKQTGWHTVIVDVSAIDKSSGLNGILYFEIQDGSQDRPYHSYVKDSALLIDNIRLDTKAIPRQMITPVLKMLLLDE
jgi:hypothetical protein